MYPILLCSNTEGSDYTATTQEVAFAPGDTLQTIVVTINNDNVYEGLEEFTAELTTTDSEVDIFQPDVTARINDDDGKQTMLFVPWLYVFYLAFSLFPFHLAVISVQFSPTSYSVAEGGSVQLVVQKIGTADEEVTVTISTQEGTAGSMSVIL